MDRIDYLEKTITITLDDYDGRYEGWHEWYVCQKCKVARIEEGFSYCPSCGGKLKWDLKKE